MLARCDKTHHKEAEYTDAVIAFPASPNFLRNGGNPYTDIREQSYLSSKNGCLQTRRGPYADVRASLRVVDTNHHVTSLDCGIRLGSGLQFVVVG